MKTLKYTLLLFVAALFTSCSDGEDPAPAFDTDLTEITSFTENNITVTLFASENLFVGYNAITAKIQDASGQLLNGDISVMPMMEMMTMSHSCPIDFPDGDTFKNGAFSFNPVFVMPSGEMGSWRLIFTINDQKVNVPVNITSPAFTKLVSFTSLMDDKAKYFVAYVNPKDPKVGQNDLEIAVYKRQSMMEWPAVEGMIFNVEPWMVSMDHGSPNNVAPKDAGEGHYKGKVNFTMTGDWQIRLTMKDKDAVCGKPYFDINFQ